MGVINGKWWTIHSYSPRINPMMGTSQFSPPSRLRLHKEISCRQFSTQQNFKSHIAATCCWYMLVSSNIKTLKKKHIMAPVTTCGEQSTELDWAASNLLNRKKFLAGFLGIVPSCSIYRDRLVCVSIFLQVSPKKFALILPINHWYYKNIIPFSKLIMIIIIWYQVNIFYRCFALKIKRLWSSAVIWTLSFWRTGRAGSICSWAWEQWEHLIRSLPSPTRGFNEGSMCWYVLDECKMAWNIYENPPASFTINHNSVRRRGSNCMKCHEASWSKKHGGTSWNTDQPQKNASKYCWQSNITIWW